MRCLIIDDKKRSSEQLEVVLVKMPGISKVHKVLQPYIVRSILGTEEIGCVFIKLKLWDPVVFSSIEKLPPVVFLTGKAEQLAEDSRFGIPQYLREPYQLQQVTSLLERLHTQPGSNQFLFIRSKGKLHKICFADIELIERTKIHAVAIWGKGFSLVVPGTLKAWLDKMPAEKFVRISDTLILPIEKLKEVNGNEYRYNERIIPLTFRFAAGARKEQAMLSEWTL